MVPVAATIPRAIRHFKGEIHHTSDTGTQCLPCPTGHRPRQHDIHELNRVLCDTLERKMKMTEVAGTMELLFKGVTTNVIQCPGPCGPFVIASSLIPTSP